MNCWTLIKLPFVELVITVRFLIELRLCIYKVFYVAASCKTVFFNSHLTIVIPLYNYNYNCITVAAE